MGILLLISIVILYGYLGYRLKKNFVLWGLMGLGIFIGPVLLVMMTNFIFPNRLGMLHFWPLAMVAGPLFSLIIAGIIAYRNNDVFKRHTFERNHSNDPQIPK
ncbi:MAG TPA: hypothetical protein VHC47_09935 [Mucilaginibacter sp.]|nr:hypothetical protein [Mucilaginibacter sp.]